MSIELVINPEFQNLLDLPSEQELKELQKQLMRDNGPRDPITLWKGKNTILDGHNRYKICKANNLDFATREIELADEEAAKNWIYENQLARRNLSPSRMAYFIGMLYNASKQTDKAKVASPDGKTTAE